MRGGAFAGDVLHALVAEGAQVDAVEQLLAAAEEDRGEHESTLRAAASVVQLMDLQYH